MAKKGGFKSSTKSEGGSKVLSMVGPGVEDRRNNQSQKSMNKIDGILVSAAKSKPAMMTDMSK